MNARLLGLIAMVGSVVTIGAPLAGLAQQQPFEGAYKGSLECEQSGVGILRAQLAITVRDGRVVALASLFDIDGGQAFSPEVAAGMVDVAGAFHLADTVFTRDATFHGTYTGTFSATGGTMTGTQIWTRSPAGNGGVTRTCNGTFVRVESPRQ